MSAADYIVLAAYFAVMLWIGARYAPYMKALSTYFAGEQALPWWLAGLSFFMSYVSSLSIVVYAGIGYQFGLVSLTLYWVTVPACFISTLLLGRRWRQAVALTPIEFLERRYHNLLRQLFAWTGAPLRIVDDALKLLALSIFLSRGIGLSLDLTLLVVGVVVSVYTFLGGLWAVSLTDVVQFVIVSVALVLVLWLAVAQIGGIGAGMAKLPPDFWRLLAGPYTLSFWLALVLLTLMAFSSNWALIQRFYSTRGEREALRAGLFAGLGFIFLPPLWIFSGIAARALVSGLADPQYALAEVATRTLPAGVLGLMIAALLAAAMSTLSADYNVVASVITIDVVERFKLVKTPTIWWARAVTVVVGLLSVAIAFFVAHRQVAIFDAMVTVFGLMTAPMALPLTAGLLTRRVSWPSALGGYLAGVAAALVITAFKSRFSGYAFQTAAVFVTTTATLVTMLVVERLSRQSERERERISAFFESLTTIPTEARVNPDLPSPLKVAGAALGFLGLVLAVVGIIWQERLTLLTGLVMGGIGGVGWRKG